MTHQLAAALTVLLATAPALAQAGATDRDTELELGGGWMLADPLDVPDLEGPGGPTAGITWTRWAGRSGLAIGVTSIFGVQDDFSKPYSYDGPIPTSVSPVPHIYQHTGWRRRWMNADGLGFLHLGIGGGPLFHQGRVGRGRYRMSAWPAWHVEVMATRALRDGLHLRVGADTIQWLFVPLTLQASAKLVWAFGN